MSLINDALKRASQSDKNRPREAAPPAVMLPAPERRRSTVPILLAVGMAVVILLSLAMAGVLLWLVLPRNHNLAAAPPPAASSESPSQITNDKFSMTNSQSTVSSLVASPLPVAASTNIREIREIRGSTPAPLSATASTNDAVRLAFDPHDIAHNLAELFQSTTNAAPSTDSGTVSLSGGMRNMAAPPRPAGAAPPVFPELKLQAIFYSRTNPRAVINGQTVGEKELVGGVSVVTITQNKVTVLFDGQTRDLKLQGP